MKANSLVIDNSKFSSTILAWVIAARPKTLTASLVPILVATALALNIYITSPSNKLSLFPWQLGFLSLLCALFIQIGTNYINDALDFARGADTKDRLGPTRVVASGILDMRTVRNGGLVAFLLAIIFSLPLVQSGGVPILLIGIFSIISGYLYTGGPRPLAYSGLGDFFVLIFFGWVAVSGLFFLYLGYLSIEALITGTQIGLLATLLIAINNLRDYTGDRLANKMTLAARYGVGFGRFEIIICSFLPFLFSLYWFLSSYYFTALLPFISLPIALNIANNILRLDPSPEYNKYLAKAALLHLTFGILLSLGLLIDILI